MKSLPYFSPKCSHHPNCFQPGSKPTPPGAWMMVLDPKWSPLFHLPAPQGNSESAPFSNHKPDHVTPLFRTLQWLPV